MKQVSEATVSILRSKIAKLYQAHVCGL